MKKSKYIDNTLLKPETTRQDIIDLCLNSKENDFFSVCLNPYWVKFAKEILKDSDVKVCSVIGFPLGANTLTTKLFETQQALNDGADEIDMVINIGLFKMKEDEIVLNEINELKKLMPDKVLKVIVETCLLTKEEVERVSNLILKSDADYIKTSTGFSTGGARIEDVVLIKSIVQDKKLIKASGGIKTKEDFTAMIEAGANRIGTSGGVKIVNGETHTDGY